jgi:mediator of RNA polymerase II transcription subunit 22
MKLLLLLSDESQIASRRDAELKAIQTEKQETIKKVAHLLDQLLGRSGAAAADDAMEM